MVDIKKDDYIEGKEYFGSSAKTIRGWVDRVTKFEDNISVDIQCDDAWRGYRGTMVHSELGEIKVLDRQERPKITI